jgi:hypothetical protein
MRELTRFLSLPCITSLITEVNGPRIGEYAHCFEVAA